MPRFYFHLSAPAQDFQDIVGSDMADLSAVHSRAVLLADRVMLYPFIADCAPDFWRWTVKVTDESQRPVMTVIFPAHFEPGEPKPPQAEGARTLLLRLGATLTASALLHQSPRQPKRHS
jgi:hypothetical protein